MSAACARKGGGQLEDGLYYEAGEDECRRGGLDMQRLFFGTSRIKQSSLTVVLYE